MENNTQEVDSVVQKALEAVANYKGKKEGGKKGWIAGLAAGILTLVALGLLFWKLFQNGKKQARIAHERDMLVEKEHQAVVDSRVAENIQEMGKLLDEADKARAQVSERQKELLEVRRERAETKEIIQSLKTWEDIDKYLEGKP